MQNDLQKYGTGAFVDPMDMMRDISNMDVEDGIKQKLIDEYVDLYTSKKGLFADFISASKALGEGIYNDNVSPEVTAAIDAQMFGGGNVTAIDDPDSPFGVRFEQTSPVTGGETTVKGLLGTQVKGGGDAAAEFLTGAVFRSWGLPINIVTGYLEGVGEAAVNIENTMQAAYDNGTLQESSLWKDYRNAFGSDKNALIMLTDHVANGYKDLAALGESASGAFYR